jgi:hypothetical protein
LTKSFSVEDVQNVLRYINKYKSLQKIANKGVSNAGRTANTTASGGQGSLFELLTQTVIEQGAGLLSGVRNLVSAPTELPLTKLTDALMVNGNSNENNTYLYFDPKVTKTKGALGKTNPARTSNTSPYKDAFVFVIGGGCYSEYQNLLDYVARINDEAQSSASSSGATSSVSKTSLGQVSMAQVSIKTITYGTTEVYAPDTFVSLLSKLGAGVPKTKDSTVMDGSLD